MSLISGIKKKLNAGVAKAKEVTNAVVGKANKVTTAVVNKTKDTFDAGVAKAKEITTAAVNTAKDISLAVGDATRAAGNVVGNMVKATGTAVGNAVKATGEVMANTAKAVGELAVDTAKAVGELAVDTAKAVGGLAVDTAKAVGELAVDTAKAVGTAVGDATKAVGNVVSNAVKTVGNVLDNVADAVGAATKAVGAVVSNVAGAIIDFIKPKKVQHMAVEQWGEKMALVERGLSSSDPKVRAAAEEMKQSMVAQQMTMLSEAVYGDPVEAPPGWKDISNDPEALAAYGLKPSDFNIDGTNFCARMFAPDPAVFGDTMKPTLAFKGTTPSNLGDWKNNAQQGLNAHSDYYERAVDMGLRMERAGAAGSMNITGHSLGGGLASAAASASGADAYTFNASGLHPDTLARYGASDQNPNILAYHVKGEVLTGAQNLTPIPEARGTRSIELPSDIHKTTKAAGLGGLVGTLLGGPLGGLAGSLLAGSGVNHLIPAVKDGMQIHLDQSEARLRELL